MPTIAAPGAATGIGRATTLDSATRSAPMNGDKSDNRWHNAIPLCQVCHLTVQAKVIPERPYLWEHSRWFIPYVCGFYAHYYGQEEITRAEADARPDYWLALGQPWRAAAND
jgi:hypothetical protein